MRHSSRARVVLSSATVLLLVPIFSVGVKAQQAGYLRIVPARGAMLDGGSKDPAHLNWVSIVSVVSGNLTRETQADREASAPSVSELTARAAQNNTAARRSASSAGRPAVSAEPAASGAAIGKRMHQPFVITKEMDSASPKLYQAVATGEHFKEVDVDLVSTGGHFKLYDVLITSARKSAGERPLETITFQYAKIERTK